MHTDPVCNMEVDEDEAEGSTNYKGQTYYFCSTECQEKFEKNPQQYVERKIKGGGGAR